MFLKSFIYIFTPVSYFHCHYHSYLPPPLLPLATLIHSPCLSFSFLFFAFNGIEVNVLIAAQFYFNYFIVWIAKVINFFVHFCVFAAHTHTQLKWELRIAHTHIFVDDLRRKRIRFNAPVSKMLPILQRDYCNHINYTAIYSVMLCCVMYMHLWDLWWLVVCMCVRISIHTITSLVIASTQHNTPFPVTYLTQKPFIGGDILIIHTHKTSTSRNSFFCTQILLVNQITHSQIVFSRFIFTFTFFFYMILFVRLHIVHKYVRFEM